MVNLTCCMKKVNVSTKDMGRFAGKWVIIDPQKKQVVAVGSSLKEIASLTTRSGTDKRPSGTTPFSFLVPRKGEGQYVLWIKLS